ncbi:MAG: protein phosphatase CheZ [Alphaproteobacteria bacterium]
MNVEKILADAHKKAEKGISREEVTGIVHEVLSTMKGDVSGQQLGLFQEIQSLGRYIQQARSEISMIRPDEIRNKHIPNATDELDAVVFATEKATGEILDNCEKMQAIADGLSPEQGDELFNHITAIFEACNFQDITGQRISKVVRTLKNIEVKVQEILEAFGQHIGEIETVEAPPEEKEAEENSLLNGPQLPGNAMDQSEIDRLLASFD